MSAESIIGGTSSSGGRCGGLRARLGREVAAQPVDGPLGDDLVRRRLLVGLEAAEARHLEGVLRRGAEPAGRRGDQIFERSTSVSPRIRRDRRAGGRIDSTRGRDCNRSRRIGRRRTPYDRARARPTSLPSLALVVLARARRAGARRPPAPTRRSGTEPLRGRLRRRLEDRTTSDFAKAAGPAHPGRCRRSRPGTPGTRRRSSAGSGPRRAGCSASRPPAATAASGVISPRGDPQGRGRPLPADRQPQARRSGAGRPTSGCCRR